jgi:hypothetical protein
MAMDRDCENCQIKVICDVYKYFCETEAEKKLRAITNNRQHGLGDIQAKIRGVLGSECVWYDEE